MKKQYLKALFLGLFLISSGAFAYSLPKSCPTLAQVMSENDMRFEEWEISHSNLGDLTKSV